MGQKGLQLQLWFPCYPALAGVLQDTVLVHKAHVNCMGKTRHWNVSWHTRKVGQSLNLHLTLQRWGVQTVQAVSSPETLILQKWNRYSSLKYFLLLSTSTFCCHLPNRSTLTNYLLPPRCGGTVGAILTCPLEVVKTRLQSSSITLYISEVQLSTVNGASVARVAPPGPLHCLK